MILKVAVQFYLRPYANLSGVIPKPRVFAANASFT